MGKRLKSCKLLFIIENPSKKNNRHEAAVLDLMDFT